VACIEGEAVIVGRTLMSFLRTAALAAVLLTACADETPPPPTTEQSAAAVPHGLAVLEHQIPIENAAPGSNAWDLEFTIDSLFYLLHGNEPIVRVFTHDGKPVRTIQTSSQTPSLLGWKGDSLWVFDKSKNRIALFTNTGTRGRAWNPLPDSTKARQRFQFVGLLDDGSALAKAEPITERTDSAVSSALVRIRQSDGVQLDTFARFTAGTTARAMVSSLDGMIWLVTESMPRPDSGVIGVIKLKPDGETVFSKAYSYQPLPSGQSFLSSVTGAFEAANGSILVRREDVSGDLVLWTVLNRAGDRVAELDTPRNADILVADGTFVYGITQDDRSRPAITRYKIERPDTIKKR
jgi:hypothetical protein